MIILNRFNHAKTYCALLKVINKEINLNTNALLKKITIAFNLKKSDVIDVFKLSGYDVNPSQIGAFLVNPKHKNYKEIEEAVLADFLDGLILYSRGTKEEPHIPPFAVLNSIQSLAESGNEEALQAIDQCTEQARAAMEEGLFEEDED